MACRASGCNWDGGRGMRERVRRLYVAGISNKLSADPLARSFIMTSTRLPGRAWTRCHQRVCVRTCVRPVCISYDFETSVHVCERTSTYRAKTVVINDVTGTIGQSRRWKALHFLPRSFIVHSLLFCQSRIFFFFRGYLNVSPLRSRVLFSFSRAVIRYKKKDARSVRNPVFPRMVNRNVLRYESC